MNEPRQPNRDQAALWNEGSGRAWVELQDVLDRMLAPFVVPLVEAGFPGEGTRVLDIGCGAGASTLAMTRRLGPKGHCVGVDISGLLVAVAKKRALDEGASADFIQADAQTHAFESGAFDAVISRFGVMFFDDPTAAFANIRGAARKDAKLAFIAWRSPSDNPFMTAAGRAAAPLLPKMQPPNPDAPGQFAFSDGEKVRRILTASGWTDIDVRPIDVTCTVSEKDLEAYSAKLGPVGAALREADEATRARVAEVVRGAFEPYLENGVARFSAACWLVTAHA